MKHTIESKLKEARENRDKIVRWLDENENNLLSLRPTVYEQLNIYNEIIKFLEKE